MMHAVHGYFRFAHIEDLIGSEPAVYARLPTIHGDESRTQGLDRLELTGFLQVAQTLGVHHGALAYLLGINPCAPPKPRPVLHLVGKGNKPATMLLTVPVLRVWPRRAYADDHECGRRLGCRSIGRGAAVLAFWGDP